MRRQEYIGDGVYVEFDGYALVLTTGDGRSFSNRIVLEPNVYDALTAYVARLKMSFEKENPHDGA